MHKCLLGHAERKCVKYATRVIRPKMEQLAHLKLGHAGQVRRECVKHMARAIRAKRGKDAQMPFGTCGTK
ncbi:hypothetical protein KI387_038153, partial [Taxus chinensis]